MHRSPFGPAENISPSWNRPFSLQNHGNPVEIVLVTQKRLETFYPSLEMDFSSALKELNFRANFACPLFQENEQRIN